MYVSGDMLGALLTLETPRSQHLFDPSPSIPCKSTRVRFPAPCLVYLAFARTPESPRCISKCLKHMRKCVLQW